MEIQCDTCSYIFTDKISYDIHIKLLKCVEDNKNNKNYYCSVCDRQFRLLSNLQRHQETITHQDALEQIIKQENITKEDDDVKSIVVDLTPRRKELSLEDMDKLNQEKQKKYDDDDTNTINDTINDTNNNTTNTTNNTINDTTNNEKEDIDIFLIQLKKQRELDLLPLQHPTPKQKTITIEQPILIQKNQTNTNTNINNSNMYIAEDPGFNLALEIEKTKILLNDKNENDVFLNSNHEDDFLNIFKIKQKELLQQSKERESEKEKEIPLIIPKKHQQITKINNTTQQNNKLYPPEFKNTPVWEKLSTLIKNNISKSDINIIAARFILTLLVNSPLSDYLIICTYVYYSEDLDNNKDLRAHMIKGMLEVYNNYIKLSRNRQILWNNKNVAMAINMMNNWKIESVLKNFL